MSPDGAHLAAWHDSAGLEVWDLHSGQSLGTFDGLATAPFTTLVSDARSGEKVDTSRERQLVVSFSPHSDAVTVTDAQGISSGADGGYSSGVRTIRWSLRTDEWVAAACTIVGRDLTTREWNTYIGSSVPYHPTCTPLLKPTTP